MDSNLVIQRERPIIDKISDMYNYDSNIRHLLYKIIPAFIIKYGKKKKKLIIDAFKKIRIVSSDKQS